MVPGITYRRNRRRFHGRIRRNWFANACRDDEGEGTPPSTTRAKTSPCLFNTSCLQALTQRFMRVCRSLAVLAALLAWSWKSQPRSTRIGEYKYPTPRQMCLTAVIPQHSQRQCKGARCAQHIEIWSVTWPTVASDMTQPSVRLRPKAVTKSCSRDTDAALHARVRLCGGAGKPDRMVVEHTSLCSAGTVTVWQDTHW